MLETPTRRVGGNKMKAHQRGVRIAEFLVAPCCWGPEEAGPDC